jgi:FtsZ-binding cell division protein ZapB
MDNTLEERVDAAIDAIDYYGLAINDNNTEDKRLKQLIRDMQERIADLEKKLKNAWNVVESGQEIHDKNVKLEQENTKLRTAISKTLEENGHLADGDVCTLIELKRAINYDTKES